MKPQSRYIIHIGIDFITIPVPVITQQTYLLFQQAIMSEGLEFPRVENMKGQIVLTRESPSPLQVTVTTLESQVGQFLVMAPAPKGALELFLQETEAAINAFETVWPAPNRQIIRCDATIRELYETTSQHAFQELWEKRLSQPSQSLATFGRPIRGGGLRFVMDPLPNDPDPIQIEVKIESFLRDTTKIFVETQFVWLMPTQPGAQFDSRQRLSQMNGYAENQINKFLLGESQ